MAEIARLDRRNLLAGGLALFAAGGGISCKAQSLDTERSASTAAAKLIASARQQIGVTLDYDPSYSALAYPGGDIARSKGVCTDVIVRAYRDALEFDLQQLVHRDMKANFTAYPANWGLRRPDRNIDHRRVPNLRRFWKRAGARLAIPAIPDGWQPGDIFTSRVGGTLPHMGIVSDRVAADGKPFVIHNIGGGAREEAVLFEYPLTGRYRWRV
ncbi:MAG: DUF1287 domain-containing protein [Novosphingobium sp.]|nr:DUF1287 domain-containing protein [Novosphingobium sp.]